MKSVLIRNLNENTLRSLKRLAEFHHRSLQGELHYILEKAAMSVPENPAPSLKLTTVRTNSSSQWNREEIYGDEGR